MNGRLSGRTAVVTGAGQGIGRAIAERFSAEGARVVSVLRPGRREQCAGVPGSLRYVEANIADPDSMYRIVNEAADGTGLDICVANAGLFREYLPFVEADPAIWTELIEVNLLGVLATFQAAARRMIEDRRGGRLIVTSSLAGLRGEARSPVYGATKAAVRAVVQSLAAELGEHGITVNAIAPGQIDTEMNARNMRELGVQRGQTLREVRKAWLDRIPAARLGTPEEVAAAFAFLASDDGAFVSGETIRVDGGELIS